MEDKAESDRLLESELVSMMNGQFYDDLMRIFNNCIHYNGQFSEIGSVAVMLKNEVSKMMNRLVSKYSGESHRGCNDGHIPNGCT